MDYQDKLMAYKDPKYLEFHKKLVTSNYAFIGIRVPNLKKIAKEIYREDGLESIKYLKDEYYEEVLIKGFIIASAKIDYAEKVKLIAEYVSLIDNWALCDSFISALKYLDLKKYFKEVKKYLKSNKEYELRFGLVMLLNYYIDLEHIDYIYSVLKEYRSDKYYYLMAKAWLLSYMFIYYFDSTVNYVKNNRLDEFTYRKGITKAIESFRIDSNKKDYLRKLREQYD